MPDAISQPGLADRLREGTREAHTAAERAPFVRAFMKGGVDPAGYRAYLLALWHIYAALEEGLQRHREHPVAGALALPELYRAPAIAADLRALFDLDPHDAPAPPAAIAYANHLRALADTNPDLLLAHAYTRYLGDLSGGQILRRFAARLLGRPETGPGLAFYDFPEVTDIDACKASLRGLLDEVAVDADGVDALVAAARDAFARNGAVFAELPIARRPLKTRDAQPTT